MFLLTKFTRKIEWNPIVELKNSSYESELFESLGPQSQGWYYGLTRRPAVSRMREWDHDTHFECL